MHDTITEIFAKGWDSMPLRAIDHNVNIIAMEKEGHRYGMCCAWVTHCAEDRLLCFVGPQSVTGQALRKGDTVGFSNLMKGQEAIAFSVGDTSRHSPDSDKLAGIDFENDEGALIVKGARCEAKCRVVDVLHIEGIEQENALYLEIVKVKMNDGESLHMSDIRGK